MRMTDIEGFLTIYGHSDNLLNNKYIYLLKTGLGILDFYHSDWLNGARLSAHTIYLL